jgi:FkbM family methyltransferase
LQVGANDGILDDPINHLVIAHNLAGLLIEPLPDLFAKLLETYSGQSQLAFENVAIGDRAGMAQIHRVKAGARVQEHLHGSASFSRQHLIKEGVPAELIEGWEVKVVTMSDLLTRHAIRRIDLLQVDVEGYDYEIVKSVFEIGLRPAIINYEHCHLVPQLRTKAKRMLVEHGYRFIEVGKDTLAVHEG